MKQHIFTGTTAPSTVPEGLGHHYVDTVAKKTYISVGTTLVSDWKTTDESDVVENAIVSGVIDKAPSQDAVYNALNSVGAQIPRIIGANLTVLSDFVLIRSHTKVANGVTLKVANNGLLKII